MLKNPVQLTDIIERQGPLVTVLGDVMLETHVLPHFGSGLEPAAFFSCAHPLSWAMISRLYKIAPVTEINLQKLSKLIGKIHKIIAECIVITWVIFAQMIIIR